MILTPGSSSFGMEPTSQIHVGSSSSGAVPIRANRHERADEISTGVSIDQVGRVGDDNNLVDSELILESKHKVFLSHSGAQKDFVEQLCVDLERCDRYSFFDKLRTSLPIGKTFPKLIFDAIKQCYVGVVVLSEEFFMSKWPMLELCAMMKESIARRTITIVPVFYRISVEALKNPDNNSRWTSQWVEWASNDDRINVNEWKMAMKKLGSINGIVMKEGLSEVKLRDEIVDQVRELVPREIRWDDSHVQGSKRICKIIQDKVNAVETNSGVCLVGLYGIGGIGKTTISKALCNDLLPKFGDNVCHIEFGSRSEMKLLRKALKKLTNVRHDIVDKLDGIGEGYAYLKSEQSIFLVLDNVQDDLKGWEMAKRYLKASYGRGSVVLVTARSLDVLKGLHINDSNCLEMPELDENEARSLFLKCADLPLEYQGAEVLIRESIERCHFFKGNGICKHYHPLALKVWGQKVGCDPRRWEIQLKRMTFDQRGDRENPVFSIFRNSFDSLKLEHQVIFKDLALLITSHYDVLDKRFTRLDYLCMVHETSVEDMKDKLEVLKRKSLVEELSDDFSKIGMHDLWIEFAVAEIKANDVKDRRWVYHMDEKLGTLGRRGLEWREEVERMVFLEGGWKALTGLNLNDFGNVKAFKMQVFKIVAGKELRLDLSGLKLLSTLEVYAPGLKIRAHGLSSLTNLAYLLYVSPGFSPWLNKIGCLTNLQYLFLMQCKGVKVLDLSELILLRLVAITGLQDLVVVKGFSSRFANFRLLALNFCKSLRQCHGVGELIALENIGLVDCGKLEKLPCLRRLINLRVLDITLCKSIRAVPGVSDLVALEEFYARGSGLATLPDLVKLTKLGRLEMQGCPVQEVPGLDGLISLTSLRALFGLLLGEQPNLSKLSALTVVEIEGWNGPFLTTVRSLLMLEELKLENCKGEDVVPNLQNLKRLKSVVLRICEYRDLSGFSNSTALEKLEICLCGELERLPEFEKLMKLTDLSVTFCYNLKDWPSVSTLCSLKCLELDEVSLTGVVRGLETMTGLRELSLWGNECENVLSMASVMSRLEILRTTCFSMAEELGLSIFPSQLKELELRYCSDLRRVSCSSPLTRLMVLKMGYCESLVEMPDLSLLPHLEELQLERCGAINRLTCSSPLNRLMLLEMGGCESLVEMPDLSLLPHLEDLRLEKCGAINSLTCSSPLTALRSIELIGYNWRLVVPAPSMVPNLEYYGIVMEVSSCSDIWGLFRLLFYHSQ